MQELGKSVPVEYYVRNGYLFQEIVVISKVCHIDLFMMATKGASSLNEIISSTAAERMAKTHCPVWTVSPKSV